MLINEFLDKPRTLFASRLLLNYEDIREWATVQGFKSILEDGDMHVTIAFSKEKFPWDKLTPKQNDLTIQGGKRQVQQFGDATVLEFSSRKLKERWQEFRDAGASYDFPEYRSHVTISYEAADLDLEAIEPYDGELVFGPEILKEINDDWSDDIEEVDL